MARGLGSGLGSWRRTIASLALGAALGAPLAAAADAIDGRCAVRFFASATLHDFEGEAPCALLAIDAPDASGRYAARAEVAIAQLATGISARDEQMREMFEVEKFPRIVATFSAVDPAALRAQQPTGLPFRLTLHGVERSVTPAISRFSEDPGKSARFRATFHLGLRDFGLEAPVAMGFLRVHDDVKVVVDVELLAIDAPPPAPAGAR